MFQESSQACTCKLWLQLSVEETEPHSDQTMATSSLQLSKCEHPKTIPSIGRRQQRWSNAESIPSDLSVSMPKGGFYLSDMGERFKMELHFQLESLSIFKRKIKFPFENKQDQLNLCEEERSRTPGHRSQGWGKGASQVSSLGPLNYWPRTGTLRGRTGRACPLSQPPGTSAHSPLWPLARTTSHLPFILSAEAWSRMALQPMPCSLPEKLPFALPQERHPALPWAGEKRKGSPSCLPILPPRLHSLVW